MTITIVIPGPPHAQGRPRATVRGKRAAVYDPPKSKAWKEMAAHAIAAQYHGEIMEGAIYVKIAAIFPLPKSYYRKKKPIPRDWHTSKPDVDNVAKAVLDATGNVGRAIKGVFSAGKSKLWHDDCQVARLWTDKITGAQGEEPRIIMQVGKLPPLEG